MNPVEVFLDLTPWARGPHTGVGLTAYHSFRSLDKMISEKSSQLSQFKLHGVSRTKIVSPFKRISLFRRWQGWRKSIYHSFELKLLPVTKCYKVLTVHDVWSLSPNTFQSPHFQKIQGPKLEKSILKADHIAVPSACVKAQIRSHFPNLKTPISVIPWGPSVEAHDAVPDSNELKTYFEQKRPFLLCVATLEKRKNYELLLDAMTPEIAKKVDLVTVGQIGFGGESVDQLLKSMRHEYLGGLDLRRATSSDLQSLYAKCQGLVLVSHDEGFGIPVLEALSFGKPVITSDIPSLREIAGPQGRYVSLKQGKEPLTGALNELLSTPWKDTDISKSKEWASQFSWENTAKKTLEIYKSLIEN